MWTDWNARQALPTLVELVKLENEQRQLHVLRCYICVTWCYYMLLPYCSMCKMPWKRFELRLSFVRIDAIRQRRQDLWHWSFKHAACPCTTLHKYTLPMKHHERGQGSKHMQNLYEFMLLPNNAPIFACPWLWPRLLGELNKAWWRREAS